MTLGPDADKYCLSKDILCTKDKFARPHKIYLPDTLKDLVFRYFHDSLMGGHLGFFKTKFAVYSSGPFAITILKGWLGAVKCVRRASLLEIRE